MQYGIEHPHKVMLMYRVKEITLWCIMCIIIFLISIFIHECGHGIANSLRGIECSTGFNRVGDIYKFPKDVDFRAEYSMVSDSLLDFGVPATLILAIVGTALFYKLNRKIGQVISLGIAAANSLMRLIPCLYVVFVPLLTGSIHNEDEYGMGLVLAEIVGFSWLVYLPALISILISVVCIIYLFKKLSRENSLRKICIYVFFTLISFDIAMIIANILDNSIRLNWRVYL